MSRRLTGAKVIVFGKKPEAGRVKTRLFEVISPMQAARLHTQLLEKTLKTASEVPHAHVEVWGEGERREPFFMYLAQRYQAVFYRQKGVNLGERMRFTFQQGLDVHRKVILVGSDCPALSKATFQSAIQSLDRVPAVFVPAMDGGYTLIGLRQVHPYLFWKIAWGTQRVMAQTRSRLQVLRWRWDELSETWDLDRPEDLKRLMDSGIQPVSGDWID